MLKNIAIILLLIYIVSAIFMGSGMDSTPCDTLGDYWGDECVHPNDTVKAVKKL